MDVKYSNEEIKERLFLSIVNRSKVGTDEYLADTPYEVKGEFALVPRFCVGDFLNENPLIEGSAKFTLDMAVEAGITADEAISLAKKNSLKLFPGRLEEVSGGFEDETELFDGILAPQIFSLGNNNNPWSSSVIFYQPELIENLAKLQEQDILVFPLFDNAVYAMPVSGTAQHQELEEAVREGAKEISETLQLTVLSSNALLYDRINQVYRQTDVLNFSVNLPAENVTKHFSR